MVCGDGDGQDGIESRGVPQESGNRERLLSEEIAESFFQRVLEEGLGQSEEFPGGRTARGSHQDRAVSATFTGRNGTTSSVPDGVRENSLLIEAVADIPLFRGIPKTLVPEKRGLTRNMSIRAADAGWGASPLILKPVPKSQRLARLAMETRVSRLRLYLGSADPYSFFANCKIKEGDDRGGI
jgi:hypothetical protein